MPTLSTVAGLALILCGISFVSTDELCGDGAFQFHNECYLWQRGNCPLDSVHIRDKCCGENCVRNCKAPNCWHCCANIVPVVSTPPLSSNSNQVSVSNPVSNCNGAPCTSCCQNQGQSSSCSNCGSGTPCNQGGCQQTNCCNGGSGTPCNQGGCLQTNCCNCGSGTPCNQGGCKQTNCCNGGSGTPCNQGGCLQTNCCICGSGTQCNQAGCQQTNCCNGGSGTPCNQCQQTTRCNIGSGTQCNQGNNGRCGSPCNQDGGQQSNCNNVVTNCNTGTQPNQNGYNWPFSPVIPTTTSTTPVPYTPPPASLQCPPGTVPIGRTCRILYCPKGTIMKNNECTVIACPEGTVWNGYKCVISEPIPQNITYYNTIITQSNASKPDINLNSYTNFTITLPINVEQSSTYNGSCGNSINSIEPASDESTDCGPEATEPPPPAATKCCTVMTPRTCVFVDNHWKCNSQRHEKCGNFCTTPVVFLKPPRIYAKFQHVVMPPLQVDYASGAHSNGGIDCSGCAHFDMQRCSNYCYRYSCPSQSCGFYDQQKYCTNYPGSFGCMEADGCFDNRWCS